MCEVDTCVDSELSSGVSVNSLAVHSLSRRHFKRILDHYFEVNEVAVRQKKNVTGKCEGLVNLASLKHYHFIFC